MEIILNDKTMTSDRRAHPRFQTQLEVHGLSDSGETVARMVTSDLSMGGVLCVSPNDYPEMTRLAVRLMLPQNGGGADSARPVEFEAVVVRREPLTSSTGTPRFELALFFTHFNNGAKEDLESFLLN